ncbi:MAG: pilus assembly protein PilP [Candidatus Thiodiazotropha sp.]
MIGRVVTKAASALARVASVTSIVMLAGCASPNLDELKEYVDAKKAEPPGRIESLPEIKQITTYFYEADGRRDPFVPIEAKEQRQAGKAVSGISPNFNRRKEELEHFSLDSIRMVGTLEQLDVTWGLVKTKEGTIHRVKTGNYMGQNHGRIVLISEDKIELTEIVQDGTGGYRKRQASLALAE